MLSYLKEIGKKPEHVQERQYYAQVFGGRTMIQVYI